MKYQLISSEYKNLIINIRKIFLDSKDLIFEGRNKLKIIKNQPLLLLDEYYL